MIVVGVDGCKGGWVAAVWNVGANQITLERHELFESVVKLHLDEACAIGVDIPIGLMPCYRACDSEARKAIRPRSSCVFDAPPYRAMFAEDFRTAADDAGSECGKMFSIQAFSILPKMIEVNRAMNPALQEKVIEVHPDVSFWAMNGTPMVEKKSTVSGYKERKTALTNASVGTIWCLEDLMALLKEERKHQKMTGVKPDDVLDAIAGAWTARRWAEGVNGSFPAIPECNQDGLRAEIIF